MNSKPNNEHLFLTIPNAFTLSNLIFGIISITFSLLGNYLLAFISIFLAIICDGLDGFVARKLNAANEFGRELDSLSDQVSFGVAPAVLLIRYVTSMHSTYLIYSVFAGAIFASFGALRLARFNLTGTTKFFEGLAIPAAAFYASISLLCLSTINIIIVIVLYLIIASLMISSIIYPSAKTRIGVKAIAVTIILGALLAAIFLLIYPVENPVYIVLWLLFYVITAYVFVAPIVFKIIRAKEEK